MSLVAIAVAAAATALAWEFFFSPRASFRHLVIHPIRRSVRNIKVDRQSRFSLWARLCGFSEDFYVVRCDISKEDLMQIVQARGFEPCEDLKFADNRLTYTRVKERHSVAIGRLHAAWGGGHSQALYDTQQPPSWFDLGKWTDSEAYLIERDTGRSDCEDLALLIYSKQVGSAYFIRWDVTSR
jgi:hypothetical protein